jgi:LysR family cys regulon transcriptional activator
MNLHQLRYVSEIVRCKLNISRAAKSLGTSQPAISQQVRLLEEELGIKIFVRSRNGITSITPQGEAVLDSAKIVLAEVANVHNVAQNVPLSNITKIRIATMHAQARYTLPQVLGRFRHRYPDIETHITQGHDQEGGLWQMVQNNEVDLAITTDIHGLPRSLLSLACFPMQRSLIAPKGHPLLKLRVLTLEAIAGYPLVTYPERSHGRRRIMRAFGTLGYTPKVIVSAVDEDVIKACVTEGLGISILASIVYDPRRDIRLGARDVSSLLEPSVTGIVVRRSMVRLDYIAEFIEAFSPNWTKQRIANELEK